MAVGNVEIAARPDGTSGTQSDWAIACTSPHVIETDPNVMVGGKVVRPGLIVRTAQNSVKLNNKGNTLLIALQYNADVTAPTGPTVRVFGQDGRGVWHVLKDNSVPALTEIPITLAPATDTVSADGTYRVSSPVEVDTQGSSAVIVAIQGFFTGTGTITDGKILVKLK